MLDSTHFLCCQECIGTSMFYFRILITNSVSLPLHLLKQCLRTDLFDFHGAFIPLAQLIKHGKRDTSVLQVNFGVGHFGISHPRV